MMQRFLTTLITEFAIVVLSYIIVYRAAKIYPSFIVIAKALFAGAMMGGVLWTIDLDNALLNVLIGAFVYGTTIVAVRAITYNDIQELVSVSRKR
ncbi:hypothetical protein ACFL2D_01820 [Patescibacteria group bacterium]